MLEKRAHARIQGGLMRLVTFEVHTQLGRFQRLGALHGEYIVDLSFARALMLTRQGYRQAYRLAEAQVPVTLRAFIETGSAALDAATAALQFVSEQAQPTTLSGARGERIAYERNEVRLCTPLPDPGSLRDFLAFEDHAKAGAERRGESLAQVWYEMPIYYKGNPRSLVGPDEDVPWPQYTEKLDYELELACIVGREGRNINEVDAPAFIFGYSILNDFSARDIQRGEMLCRLGPAKGKDFASGLGPCVVTADEIPYPPRLEMAARVNGEVWSRGNSGAMYWSFAAMLAHASREETLYPGDILGSGTLFGGCGLDLNRWLQPGDTIELEVERIGVLRNRVIRQKVSEQRSAIRAQPQRD